VDDTGHLLENAVYLELRRRYSRLHDDAISYFAEPAGSADFIVDTGAEAPRIVQVCATLATAATRERELRGAEAAMAELRVGESILVTLHEADDIATASGTIRVVPAWRWMLEGP
jgi:predicted AAA+ superfamily ATPase